MQHRALKYLSFLILFSLIPHGSSLITLAQEPPPAPNPQAPAPAPLSQDPLQHGQELLGRGDLEGAEQALLEALQKAPGRPEPHYFLGAVYLEKGESQKAIQEFQKVLEIRPDHLLSHHNIGLAYLRLGKREEAIAAFQKAIQIEPAFYPAYLELGLIDEAQGQVEEAVGAFNAVIQYGAEAAQAQEAVKKAKERLAQTGDSPEKARQALELFKQGQEYMKKSQIKEAKSNFEEILKVIPQNVSARYLLAQTFLQMGNIFRATRLLETAANIDLNAWQIYYLLGQLYEAQGRFSEATLVYLVVSKIITEGSLNEEVRRRLASLKEILEEQKLREAIRTDIPLREARQKFEQGITALQQEDPEKAIALIKEAIALNSTNPFYHYNLGIAYFSQTRLIEAAQSIQKAIELKKDYGPAHFFLAQIYSSSGDAGRDAGDLVGADQEYSKALAEFESTLQLGAEQWQLDAAREKRTTLNETVGKIQEANGHTILGLALADRKDQEGALREFGKAAELVAQDPFSRISIGLIYEEMGEVEKAIQAYEEAAQASKLNPNPYIQLGQLYEKEKRMEEAEKAYKTAMERSPRFAESAIRLGTLYFNQDRLDEAKAQYNKAVELDPKQAEAHFYLGQIYEKEDKQKNAVQEYKKAQELLSPQMDTAQYIQNRLAALNPFSGYWSHTLISYDNNAGSVSTHPTEEISSSFSLGLTYVTLRRNRILQILPIPLAVPLDISTATTTTLRSSLLSNSETVSLSIQTSLWTAIDLGGRYSFSFSQSDQRPISMHHSWNFSIGRSGQIPSRAGLAISTSRLTSLVNSANNRVSQGIGASLSQSLGNYGSLSFNYTHSTDKTQRLDQSGRNHDFSFGYSRSLFGKLQINGGIDYTLTRFAVPRILPSRTGARIAQSIEKNTTYAFHVGSTYPLGEGVALSMNYSRLGNRSNLDIPRPPVDITQQVLELIRSTSSYQKHLFSLSISKSF